MAALGSTAWRAQALVGLSEIAEFLVLLWFVGPVMLDEFVDWYRRRSSAADAATS